MDINVMWIDDEWDDNSLFILLCEDKGINVTPFKTSQEGMDALNSNVDHWDAVILDAKGFDQTVNEQQSLKGMRNSMRTIDRLSHKKEIPYYVLTGQPDLMSNENFIEEHGRVYFKIGDSVNNTEKLIQDLLNELSDSENVCIRKKHPVLFTEGLSDIEDELLSIIKILEHNDRTNSDVFNKIRKILDWLMHQLVKYGLLVEYKGSELGACSTFLGNKELVQYVPLYIRRSLHSCTEIANNGSHRMALDEDVKSGKAPYLVNSTIYELLNILIWYCNLPTDVEHKDRIDSLVANIVLSEAEKQQKTKKSTK